MHVGLLEHKYCIRKHQLFKTILGNPTTMQKRKRTIQTWRDAPTAYQYLVTVQCIL